MLGGRVRGCLYSVTWRVSTLGLLSWMLGGVSVSADLCARSGFRSGPLLDVGGSHQLPTSSHVREKDKALLRSIMVGGVWNGFLLGRLRGEFVPCSFLWWC